MSIFERIMAFGLLIVLCSATGILLVNVLLIRKTVEDKWDI